MNNTRKIGGHDVGGRDIDGHSIDDREWQAQERALQEERLHLASGDPRLAPYRAIARALRQPLPHGLPADFARALAARLGRAPLDTRVEQGLLRGLVTLFALSGAVVAAIYGQAWVPAILAVLPASSPNAMHWLLAVGACVGMSWGFDQLRKGVRAH
jgi:hypothetical protein